MASPGEMSLMCRLCLVKDKKQVNIPIFEDHGDIRQIFLKISSCLPVKISKEDQLPKNICDGCSDKLDLLYEFWNTSLDSEKTLLSWLAQAGLKDDDQTINAVAQQIKPSETLVKEETDALEGTSFLESSIDEEAEEEVEAEEPPKKRARRTAAVKAQISITPESDEDDDDDNNMMDEPDSVDADAIAKLEDESEESDNDEKDPSYTDVPGTSNAQDQPGTSGLGKEEAPNSFKSDECRTCGQTFATKTQLEHHLLTLTIKVDRKCLICDNPKYCDHPEEMKSTRCELCDTNITEPYHLHRCFHFNANTTTRSIRATEGSNIEEHTIKSVFGEFSLVEDLETCIYCNKTMPSQSLGQHETWHRKHDKTVISLIFDNRPSAPRKPANPQSLCTYCGKIKPGNLLRRHEYVVHIRKNERKVCDVCGIFTCPTYYKEHMRTHDAEKGFKCDACGKAFYRRKALARHKLVHSDVAQYTCTVCGKSFKIKFNLRVHMRTHEDVKPFPCSVCKKTFTTKQWRDNHLKTHGIVGNRTIRPSSRKSRCHICPACSLEFPTKKLERHLDTIAVDASSSCSICKNLYCDHPAYFHSIKPKKSNPIEETDICIFCFIEIPLSSLEDHENAHREEEKRRAKQQKEHIPKEGDTICTICGTTVPCKDLKKHERTHRRLDSVVCTICGLTAKNIYQHMATHSDERRYACQECGLAFKHKKNLDAHMLVHETVGRHKCPTCSKAFKTPYNLRVHLRSHEAVKPYACQHCEKTFTTKQSRDNHMKTHIMQNV